MPPKPLEIVPADQIPQATNTPIDDLLEVYKVCSAMERLCSDLHGLGLSAVQVGIPWKLFVMAPAAVVRSTRNIHEVNYRYLLDCEYSSNSAKMQSIEGCLSLPDNQGSYRQFEVSRFREVNVRGKELVCYPDLAIVDVNWAAHGLEAIVLQHEIDHGNGILISDIGKEMSLWEVQK
jgi:peptide deformylase